ncbi:sulfatase [Shewanella corallii]|uniref:Sulfatase n=1 Tax=Shewanella corallii TaxID=560080 RepID=A0ABT0N5I8_9GAMM|nr:sulfatase [Shewanella corallii]MCL2913701.1 sulfatase [Shewanella corallii]
MICVRICLLGFLLLLMPLLMSVSADEQRPPNILFLLVDDLGWMDLGVYGSQYYETPNIDALAQQSRFYTQAYASSPVCSPTRAALVTGKHPSKLKITTHFPGHRAESPRLQEPWKTDHLALEEFTLAESLKEQGYHTFFAGKWHLGGEGKLPTDQGFDINIGGFNKGSPRGGYYDPYKNPNLPNLKPGQHLTERLTEETLAFIEAPREKPFFAMLSYYAVHTPLEPGPQRYQDFLDKSGKVGNGKAYLLDELNQSRTQMNQVDAKYASMIWAVDRSVGRLLNKLNELGLADNTVIVLTSDNGGFSTRKQGDSRVTATANLPLRLGKGWVYEGGIRIPLMIRMPAQAEQQVFDTVTSSTDLYPTLASLAGAQIPEGVDGTNLFTLDKDARQAQQRTLVWHHPHYHGSGNTPSAAIRRGDWKLLEFYEDGRFELYNLARDIAEQNNQASSNPEVRDSLRQSLRNWYRDNEIEPVKPLAE